MSVDEEMEQEDMEELFRIILFLICLFSGIVCLVCLLYKRAQCEERNRNRNRNRNRRIHPEQDPSILL